MADKSVFDRLAALIEKLEKIEQESNGQLARIISKVGPLS